MRAQFIGSLIVFVLAGSLHAAEEVTLKTPKEKISYIIGVQIGTQFKGDAIDVDPNLVGRGIQDAIAGNKLLLGDQEFRDTMNAFQKEQTAKQTVEKKKQGEKNKKEGDAFLAENKKKAGVKTTPSGLQYKVLKEGTGRKPKATDTVTTNYKGTLIDGKEFDSSYRRGEPATIQLGGVIPGWSEALQLMKEGSKWQLFIPPQLAYAEQGAGNQIGPNATLIFEVELISVK
jgi:FKBP-type peptidyl-prolyl cis-trans isomerase FklB